MSRTIDEKVVEMQFDNRQFENGVKTTMSTLDKLKQSLNLTGATKGLENVNSAIKNVDVSGLNSAIETVRNRFSALEVMSITALANITNAAVNAGKRIVSALTIDPIKTGFQEYETQMNAVQTILANTSSKGTNLEQVNRALDELNYYADKTIYNFTEMTRNIGTFTAAGIDLDTSVSAIKGIANLAAVSGSSSQQASTAMYQLSQALATGTVKLMDWNSVVNAGMGGQVFQDALKETARVHGVAVDKIIKSEGSFRDSLSKGWLTSDILTETLSKFTGDLNEKQLKTMGYTEEQIKSILKMGKTANDAATKVKTFTQLFDTLKEAAQSGWSQTWKIVVGDFEEAKELLTEVSDAFGGIISSSADARNSMLQGWKDLGGRKDLIDSLRNAFEGISSVIKPISEAFKEIFPPVTAEQLHGFTEGLKNLTEKFKMSETAASNLKKTFKGIFSVFDIVITVIKELLKGILSLGSTFISTQDNILVFTGVLGEGLSIFRDYIKNTNVFGLTIEKITKFINNIMVKIHDLGKAIQNSFKDSAAYSNIVTILTDISNAFANLDFERGLNLISQGLFASILLAIRNFVKGLTNPFEGVSNVLDNITGILDNVRGCFEAYQNQLNAGTLLKISSAIAILAGSILIISSIDEASLIKSLTAITVLFGELIGSLSLFSNISTNMVGVTKSCAVMITMSISVSILASALKKLSNINTAGIVKGLAAIGALMAELVLFLKYANLNGKMTTTSIGIVILSSALLILSKAVKSFGNLDLLTIGKGLLAIGGILTELTLFSKLSGNSNNIVSVGISMVLLSSALKSLSSTLKTFGNMSLESIGKSLLVLGGALTEITLAMRAMPNNTVSIGAGLIIVSIALNEMSKSLSKFGSMSWSDIGKGLSVLGGALAELAIGLHLMNGTIFGSTALLIASGALSIISIVMKNLGKLKWEDIAKGLITLAGAFTVIGVAGMLLTPLIPSILALSGAFALFGLSMVGIGAGLTLIGVGLSGIAAGFATLATVGAVGATSVAAALEVIIIKIAELIPTIIKNLAEGVVVFFQSVAKSGAVIADSIMMLLFEIVSSLSNYAPKIIDSLMTFLIGILEGIARNLPKLIKAAMNVIGAFFSGVVDALGGLDVSTLLKGIAGVGLLTGLMLALSSVVALIPTAMIGVLGMGIVISELALVLAAVGALAQLPGLTWFIDEGGNLLLSIGTAIGKFVGGIVGGFSSGISNSFPKIGSDLAEFMMNIKPFVDGVKSIDSSATMGMSSLLKTIVSLTAIDILNSATSWLTGGNSMSKFSKQLIIFGNSLKEYSNSISGVDPKIISNSAIAAKSLVELSNNLPKTGGLINIFTGQNDISEFGKKLVPFGKGLKEYSVSINGIDPNTISSSATAAKSLSELANNLPNTGGLISWFSGDNDIGDFGKRLVPFGKGLKEYSDSISGIEGDAIVNSATAAKSLSELANNLPDSGGLVSWFAGDNNIGDFGKNLVPFGVGLKAYSLSISGIESDTIINSVTAAKSLSELANNLPDTGGLMSWFSGDNNMAEFGTRLVPFGIGLRLYSSAITGINSDAIASSAIAAKSLGELANNLPSTGGLVSWFTGDENMAIFGSQLERFGQGLKKYSVSVYGMDKDSITNSAIAVGSLAELAKNLPTSGSLFSWFTGEKNMVDFGNQLEDFGKGLKKYSIAITNMEPDVITASSTAALSLSELANKLPTTGGVSGWFMGEQNLGVFGTNLVTFGEGLSSYSLSIKGVTPETIINSATAAKSLAELATNLPTTGGLFSWFTGDNDIASFGTNLVKFGEGLNLYSISIKDVKPEAIANSATAAKSLSSLAESIPTNGGFFSWFTGDNNISDFGSNLVPFGEGLSLYSDAVVNVKADVINNSVSATKSLISMLQNMEGLDSSGAISFKNALNVLGQTDVDGFVKAFSDSSSKLTSIGTNISDYILKGIKDRKNYVSSSISIIFGEIVSSIKINSSSCNSFGSNLISEMADGVKKNKDKLNTSISKLLRDSVYEARNFYDSFYDAGSFVVSGFANGISNNTYKATSKAKAMAAAAANAARYELDEHSPSRVFFGIGDYAGIAFVNALSKYVSKAYNAGSNVANSATEGISNAISMVSKIINSDMDASPRIKPVLDLSNVSSGINSLNNMIGANPSVDVLTNANSINSMMNRKNQNGENGEIISAIRDLKNTLNNSSSNSYTIGNITYDDGSNIVSAVESLIRAAKIERRV